MAKVLSISVPDKLYEMLRQTRGISVSAVCQDALRHTVASGDELARLGAERLRKERWAKWDVLVDKCFQAGREWAARKAAIEELEFLFEAGPERAARTSEEIRKLFKEGGGKGIVSSGVFSRETRDFVPKKCLADDVNDELPGAFADGASVMWGLIKSLLGR